MSRGAISIGLLGVPLCRPSDNMKASLKYGAAARKMIVQSCGNIFCVCVFPLRPAQPGTRNPRPPGPPRPDPSTARRSPARPGPVPAMALRGPGARAWHPCPGSRSPRHCPCPRSPLPPRWCPSPPRMHTQTFHICIRALRIRRLPEGRLKIVPSRGGGGAPRSTFEYSTSIVRL